MGKTIKHYAGLITGCAFTLSAVCQTPPCGFDKYVKQYAQSIEQSNALITANSGSSRQYKTTSSNDVKIIPVVVHIIHNGGPENISDAQVQSQIDALNEDYRKLPGTAGDGTGVDTEIQFCLAKKDPQGRCTNGIVRIQSGLTNHKSYQRADLTALSSWDAARYLNIYVVKTMDSGVLGYASFPGGPTNQDGSVMVHYAFGRTGTALAPNHLGRIATHELGHWFSLYHTFNGGCGSDNCLTGDLVCDTPPVNNPNYGCPVSANTCSNDIPNVIDQVQNYMDYTNDACKSMFTLGQKNRMHSALNTIRTVVWSPANLISTGCDPGYVSSPCNVVADFTSNGDTICAGNSVRFTNRSLNNPSVFKWYFAGGTPSVSSSPNETVAYYTTGSFPVKLVVTGSLGSDSIMFNDFITVVNPTNGRSLPFAEGFEEGVFPPNGISLSNPDLGVTWERDVIATPFEGSACARINNLINTNYGQSDALVLPAFDFTGYPAPAFLKFKWAYARSDANYSDELVVLASSDCGVNWTQLFYRKGAGMSTGPTQTTSYVPDATTLWKTANISRATYSTASRVLIKIVNVTDGGNNLYVDNINLGSNATSIDEQSPSSGNWTIYPNPANDHFLIRYDSPAPGAATIIITDVLGRTVYSTSRTQGQSDTNIHPDDQLEIGVYSVTLETGDSFVSKKLIISR